VFDIELLVTSLVQLMQLLIFIWCLISWFPNINRYEQPFRTLDRIVEPIILPFRRIIPPIGGIDLSPMVAVMALQLLEYLMRTVLHTAMS
jgi:YggT family protein